MATATKIFLKNNDVANLAEVSKNTIAKKATFPPDSIKWNKNGNYVPYNQYTGEEFKSYVPGYPWSREAQNGNVTFSQVFNGLTASAKGYRPTQTLLQIEVGTAHWDIKKERNQSTYYITFYKNGTKTHAVQMYNTWYILQVQSPGGNGGAGGAVMWGKYRYGSGGGSGASAFFYLDMSIFTAMHIETYSDSTHTDMYIYSGTTSSSNYIKLSSGLHGANWGSGGGGGTASSVGTWPTSGGIRLIVLRHGVSGGYGGNSRISGSNQSFSSPGPAGENGGYIVKGSYSGGPYVSGGGGAASCMSNGAQGGADRSSGYSATMGAGGGGGGNANFGQTHGGGYGGGAALKLFY